VPAAQKTIARARSAEVEGKPILPMLSATARHTCALLRKV